MNLLEVKDEEKFNPMISAVESEELDKVLAELLYDAWYTKNGFVLCKVLDLTGHIKWTKGIYHRSEHAAEIIAEMVYRDRLELSKEYTTMPMYISASQTECLLSALLPLVKRVCTWIQNQWGTKTYNLSIVADREKLRKYLDQMEHFCYLVICLKRYVRPEGYESRKYDYQIEELHTEFYSFRNDLLIEMDKIEEAAMSDAERTHEDDYTERAED